MLSRALVGTKSRAKSPRKHAALASSACFRRGRSRFPLVANPRRKHGTRHDTVAVPKMREAPLLAAQLADDAAQAQEGVQPREPQRPHPAQAVFAAKLPQLGAVVRAAVPHAAATR